MLRNGYVSKYIKRLNIITKYIITNITNIIIKKTTFKRYYNIIHKHNVIKTRKKRRFFPQRVPLYIYKQIVSRINPLSIHRV